MNKVAKPFKKIVREFQFGTIVLSVGGPLLSLWLDTRMPDESAASADPFGFLYSVLSALAVYGLPVLGLVVIVLCELLLREHDRRARRQDSVNSKQ